MRRAPHGRKSSARKPAPRSAAPPRVVEVTVEHLGVRGDGVADLNGEDLYLPFTVPGDRVVARVDGRRGEGLAGHVVDVLEPGRGRTEPPCPHFQACGGCSAQHVAPAAYADWKRGILVGALAKAGLSAPVAPLLAIAPGTRRRAAFAWSRRKASVQLGFNARASHQIIDLQTCLLLHPALLALVPPLRAILAQVAADGSDGDAIITLAETGADLLIEGEARLDLFDRERLAAFAEEHDLARLSWRRPGTGFIEPLAARKPAIVRFAGIAVEPPPGAFLQPSAEGEQTLAGLVLQAVGQTGPVADLYCGVGSFTLPLAAAGLAVHGVEGAAELTAALKTAAGRAQLSKVSTETRDLAHNPLFGDELKRFKAVVFDPPRAGAMAQARMLADKGPGLLVAVTCNPATFARDARILLDGGYRLDQVTPVDQFPWSAHLEAVAVFRR